MKKGKWKVDFTFTYNGVELAYITREISANEIKSTERLLIKASDTKLYIEKQNAEVIKICKNCKHWIDYNDLSGECDRTKRSIDGTYYTETWKKEDNQYPKEPYDFPELCYENISDKIGLSNFRVLFGSNFSCFAWEKK